MYKKILSAFIAVSIMISSFVMINAQAYNDLNTSDQQVAASLVSALGIMESDSADQFGAKTVVKRGQFALYVARFLKYSSAPYAAGTRGSFDDVDVSTEQGAAVQMLADIGAISSDAREFNPNVGITYPEAVTMLLNALNYNTSAQTNGGYPNGYVSIASANGLDEGLRITDTALTKSDAAIILYNALFMYPMENDNREYKKASETVLESTYHVTEVTGVVTGYGKTTLVNKSLGDTQVSIGDDVYDCMTPDIRNYIGYHVKAYYTGSTGDGEVIVAFTETQNKNTAVTIDAADIDEVTDTRVTYYLKGTNSKKTIRFSSSADIIFNNRYRENTGKLSDIVGEITDGDMTFITNDGGADASVIVINSYKHLLVERVDTRNYRLYLTNSSGTAKAKTDPTYLPDSVTADPDDVDLSVYIGDEEVGFDAIRAGDAVAMKESADGESIELYISRNVVTGSIDLVSSDTMKIGTNTYDISPFIDKTYTTGTTGTFAITTNGKILGITEVESGSNSYAYVLNSYCDPGPDIAGLKLFTSAGEVISANCAGNVSVNGTKAAFDEIPNLVRKGDLITYNVNSAGEFSRINRPYDASSKYISIDNEGTLSLYVNDTDFVKDWNKSSVRYVGGIMGMTFVTDNTTVFLMPRFDDGDESEYRILRASDLENRTYSDVTAFDIDRQGRAGALLIVEDTVDSVSMSSPLFFISKVYEAVNEDNDTITRIEGYEMGKEVVLDFDDDSKSVTYEDGWMNYSGNEDFDPGYLSLKAGDAIQYVKGNDGVVSAYRLVYNNRKTAFDSKGNFIENNASNYFEDWSGTGAVTKGDFSDNLYIAYGDVQMRYMDYMVILGLSQEDRLKYASSLSPASIMDYYRPMNLLNNAYVYVYDVKASKGGKKLEVGDMDDVQSGDVCFVRSKKMGELNEIMVYKY